MTFKFACWIIKQAKNKQTYIDVGTQYGSNPIDYIVIFIYLFILFPSVFPFQYYNYKIIK